MEISEDTLRSLMTVAKAYGSRSDARKAAVSAKAQAEEAQQDWNRFGAFADCGPSYDSAKDAADGVFREAVYKKVAAERAYKRERLTAIEKHPGIELLIEKYVHADPVSELRAENDAARAA